MMGYHKSYYFVHILSVSQIYDQTHIYANYAYIEIQVCINIWIIQKVYRF